ncbi:hypothetical protein scyTo_0010758 [Scyliorhinus torazame]|uniref:PH domain-containing protein n=1 Tax=Scyliorhinus torazame TaxID=75743 RepID=A0A401PB28_SCYTO|nr:hypothetical protein [Scyliorhinus torazame]
MSPAHKISTPTHRSASSSLSSQREGRPDGDNWEIIEGLKIGQTNVQKPDKHEGFMLKKRKWPLKGWHKRFFVLDNGMLKYSKAPIDIQKGKLHGSIDVGLSVMSIKKKARRIDLDTEEHIYHLKVKSQEVFDAWPQQNSFTWQPSIPCSTSLPASYSNSQTKVAAWLLESEEMNKCAKDLAHCQSSLVELNKLLQNLEILQRTQSAPNFTDMQANCIDITKKDKRVTRRWRTKSVSKDGKMQLQVLRSPL